MVSRNIRLLHVEDSRLEQRVISNYLSRMPGIEFDITCARSEDEAVAAFHSSPPDFVILDYQLQPGQWFDFACEDYGKKIRRSRSSLFQARLRAMSQPSSCTLEQTITFPSAIWTEKPCSGALARRWPVRTPGDVRGAAIEAANARPEAGSTESGAKEAARRLCEAFIAVIGAWVFRVHGRLRTMRLKEAHLTAQELPTLFAGVYADLASDQPDEVSDVCSLFRPILLEMQCLPLLTRAGVESYLCNVRDLRHYRSLEVIIMNSIARACIRRFREHRTQPRSRRGNAARVGWQIRAQKTVIPTEGRQEEQVAAGPSGLWSSLIILGFIVGSCVWTVDSNFERRERFKVESSIQQQQQLRRGS